MELTKNINSANLNSNTTDSNIVKSIRNKTKDNDLIITKADKSNATVIIPKVEYVNKIEEFVQSEDITETKSNPTKHF